MDDIVSVDSIDSGRVSSELLEKLQVNKNQIVFLDSKLNREISNNFLEVPQSCCLLNKNIFPIFFFFFIATEFRY